MGGGGGWVVVCGLDVGKAYGRGAGGRAGGDAGEKEWCGGRGAARQKSKTWRLHVGGCGATYLACRIVGSDMAEKL